MTLTTPNRPFAKFWAAVPPLEWVKTYTSNLIYTFDSGEY